jgi:hypothetical protein
MTLFVRQSVELFHLMFLRQLASGADRARFTLKGGCNLRFFFGSIRFSEDLDLDVTHVARGTLKNKVDRLLESTALVLPLKAKGMFLVDVSTPKQTETPQRWKLGLKLEGHSVPLRTKVEFSRRAVGEAQVGSEPVDRELARAHGVPAPVVQHYLAPAATVQKLEALLGRPETQARDVFDLHLLFAKLPRPPRLEPRLRSGLPRAVERVLSLSYDDYASQVLAYLAPDEAAPFAGRDAWDAMQLSVIDQLEELGR